MSEFRRQHPVAAIAQLLAVLRQNVPTVIILIFFGAKNSEGDYFWWSLLAGIILTFVLGIVSWFRFTFRVHDQELQINKGILVRKKLYLSRDRIQVIDITEGLLQRVFGLVKVEIKTAGGGTEKATISAITKDEAEELQALLRDGPAVEKDVDEATYLEIVQESLDYPTWRLSGKDLFYAALTSGNFGVIASFLGAIAGQLDQFITDENLDYIYEHLPGYGQLSNILWIVFLVILISYFFSFLGVILKYSDFKIQKKENELLITSGLLERKQITVPFNRIQAIRFVEGITRQPLGYGMLYVESAGFEQKDKNRSIVLVPFISKQNVASFFERFVPQVYDPETSIKPPERAKFRYLRRPNYFLIPVVSVLWFFWSPAWFFYLLVIPFTLYGWLEYKDAEVSHDDEIIKLSFRQLSKTSAYVRRNRVQVAQVSENPFQRRKDLANLNITAASGAGGKTFTVENMDETDALNVYNWASPESKNEDQVVISTLPKTEYEKYLSLLSEYSLPVSDLETSDITFYGAFENNELIGCIGMEKYEEFGLLRSLAVHPSKKGKGVGKRLVGFLEKASKSRGINEMFLLTETAEFFFEKNDYERISREDVPELVQASTEFSELCPQSAVVMKKTL